jgi:2-amino-4-hydroxy-6-hydroxymethyldihydropteridine diphosphokinase
MKHRIVLEGLALELIIGVFDWERVNKQRVDIDITLEVDAQAGSTDDIRDAVDYKSLAKEIRAALEPSQFMLIEKMAEAIASLCLKRDGVRFATVRVSKPGAVRGSRNVGVEVTRPERGFTVYIGVGSNVDPEANIARGMELLRSRFGVSAVSPKYRSPAWGVKEPQPDYINLAVSAVTDKDLFSVRAELRFIEEALGRKRTGDKFAPRALDLDLLLYGGLAVKDEWGEIPHPHLFTKRWVHKPMMDIAQSVTIPWHGGESFGNIKPALDDPEDAIRKI